MLALSVPTLMLGAGEHVTQLWPMRSKGKSAKEFWKIYGVSIYLFIGSVGDQIQGFVHTRQVLYH
jgi:hypothetical protein